MTRPAINFGWTLALAGWLWTASEAHAATPPRQVLNLNGRWQVAEGAKDQRPDHFDHTIPVPGLLDMAKPAFSEVGKKSTRREAFWYRRTFRVNGPVPEAAWLKVHKACYGTRVWLNGHDLGEHLPCFTPGWFNVRAALRTDGAEQELIIRVGADRSALPEGMAKGFDFEKLLYLPGVYDSVEFILSGAPRIVNVQTVPDIQRQQVRIVAEIEGGCLAGESTVAAQVVEFKSQRLAGRHSQPVVRLPDGSITKVDFTIPIANCRLWSPEDPFLYELRLDTGGDAIRVRFGMRTFAFNPVTQRALLNGRPYYLRGSNITLYRFFEDADRADLPWDDAWVRRLHRTLKAMHWNSLRYCIGFPPERWYEIADEEGFLIQDEYPVWLLGNQGILGGEPPDPVTAERLIPEYTEWMRERWNHPGVVIWDAQNESRTEETGRALSAVRHLDLSNRPWENGWGEPQAATDCVESHPYQFIRDWEKKKPFRMSEMPLVPLKPALQAAQQKITVPILVNEYAWLWLNRQGDPTSVCQEVYRNQLGANSTVAQRRELWARYLAAKTEFWRSHRQCAGVLHFCSLGYNRRGDVPQPEGGATSDHWLNVKRLTWQPYFEDFVRDAFNPVGVMLDFWAEEIQSGSQQAIAVAVINDLDHDWQGNVRLRLVQRGQTRWNQTRSLTVPALGRETVRFPSSFAVPAGPSELIAELDSPGNKPVKSRRTLQVRETPIRRGP